MGLNKAFERNFFLIDGAVKTSGGSLNLAKGQLAAVDQTKATADGLKVVSSFAGKAKDKKDFTLRVGIEGKTPGRSYSDKSFSTLPFALNEVTGLTVSAPQITEHVVDELVIGYDGTPGSEFNFKTGDAYFRIAVKLEGGALEFRGGKDACEYLGVNVEIPACNPFEDCVDCDGCAAVDSKAIIMEAVERLRRKQLTGGKTVADFIDITPVLECDNDLTATLIPYDFYELELCDTGDDSAKAVVAAQYNVPVKRTNRSGSTSIYEILLPNTSGAPANFAPSVKSIMPTCNTCPAGYTAIPGGYVYAFTIEDDGVDKTALIEAISNFVSGTVVRSGNNAGVGFYTAVFTDKITDAQITTLLGGAVPSNTFTVSLVGKVSKVCNPSAASTIAWTLGDTLNAVKESYNVWLPDTTCGDVRLTELQGAYSELTVALAEKHALTLTGTGGTANVAIGGTNYLATFGTSLTASAAAFVTSHAATILAAKSVVVTSVGAVIYLENVGVAMPTATITNATSDLAGTFAVATTAHTSKLALTGTSGTANITIGGTAYLATFATSLTVTAANFVTTHAAAIKANKNVTVTAASGTLTFAGGDIALPTISRANASGDLTGTFLGGAEVLKAGCQTKYTTSVISNLVGDECDDIYKDAYVTSAPLAYDNIDWDKASNDQTIEKSGNCKAGIRFKSRVFQLDGDEALRGLIGFTETSTRIQVSAGFPDEIREGIGRLPEGGYTAKYLSTQKHRTHLAGNLRHLEDEGRAYFRDIKNNRDYLGRLLRGETSNMQDNTAQYIQYKLKISSFKHAQGFAGRVNDDINYNFFVEVGKHQALEDLLNNLAANAGVSTIAAFSN